jgi:hypothetical protein
VTVDRMVFVAVEDRVTKVPVEVVRLEGDQALVRGGVQPGDRIVTTRLVNVLDGTPLQVDPVSHAGSD